jgi:hypothetical protein
MALSGACCVRGSHGPECQADGYARMTADQLPVQLVGDDEVLRGRAADRQCHRV